MDDIARLKKYFYNLLAKRDYSEQELRIKATNKQYEHNLVEQVIAELKEFNFVNDLRLTENLMEAYGQTKGPRWLRQKLQQRQISRDMIDRVMSDFHEEVSTILQEKLAHKYQITNWKELDQKTTQKVLGFLGRQGFSSPYAILKNWQH